MSAPKPKENAPSFDHRPLPYLVVLRWTADDDRPSTVHQVKTIAYTVTEAVLQAVLETGGLMGDPSRFTVESIGPDLTAYRQMVKDEAEGQ